MSDRHELAGMVNRVFTFDEFKKYLTEEVAPKMGPWRPSIIVDHNTGSNPHWKKDTTREQTLQLVKNMSVTWASSPNNWRSGPHLVLGPNNLIVAAWPLWLHGTHSPSWNQISWALEHSGDFDKEPMADDYRATSLAVKRLLFKFLGKPANNETYKHHHEDPNTSHKHCPGVNFGTKASWLAALNELTPLQKTLDMPHQTVLAFSEGMESKLKSMEAFRDKAYLKNGIWHIGWGFRDGFRGLKIDASSTMSLAEANNIFDDATSDLAQAIQTFVTAPLKQFQLDALGLIAWNIGPGALKGSTIVARLNAGDAIGAGAAFMMWIKWSPSPGAPKVDSEQLKARRTYERSVFDGIVNLAAQPKLTAVPAQPSPQGLPVVVATNPTPKPGTAPMAPKVVPAADKPKTIVVAAATTVPTTYEIHAKAPDWLGQFITWLETKANGKAAA